MLHTMQTIAMWLEDTFVPHFLARPWPDWPLLNGDTVRLVPQCVELSGDSLQARTQLLHHNNSGNVSHIRECWVFLGTLPEAAGLLAPDGLSDVQQRWLAAVEHAATQLWRTAEYPHTISAADLFSGLPTLVDVVLSHAEHGPLFPRPTTHTPQHTPLSMEIAAPGGEPLVSFIASPDQISVHILPNNGIEVVLRTPEARAVLCREDGLREVIVGPREPLRAVLGWLADAARAAGDPTVRVIDPGDAYDDEGSLWVLSEMLGQLASAQQVDWRVERDTLRAARDLPDTPGSQVAWRAFLDRHFCPNGAAVRSER